ncbi:MAG: Fic family protein [Bacilli bacterium]|nr:Fic family protein [Bacilli bacterium]
MARLNEIFDYKDRTVDEYGTLINKLNIMDPILLEQAERLITSYKLYKLCLNDEENIAKRFDKEHFYSIHKYLFEDIYPFAGQTRNEPTTKSYTFCLPQYIDNNLNIVLMKANKVYKSIKTKEDLVKFAANLYSDLDFIHAFREGNGRCEREFVRQYVKKIVKEQGLDNYVIEYDKIKNKEEYNKAVVKAAATLDTTELERILSEITIISNDNQNKQTTKKTRR